MSRLIIKSLFICITSFSFSFSSSPRLFSEDGKPNKYLQKVLALTEVIHNVTVRDIVKQTQAAWLRGEGKERWHG